MNDTVTALVLRNGTMIDGSGSAPARGDIFVRNGIIEAIGASIEVPAETTALDCTGLTVAPGFVDAHSHSDLQVLSGRREKLVQGVTSEVVGNCGFSPYPSAPDSSSLREFANGIFCGDDTWGWASPAEYLQEAGQSQTSHVASLVGHGSLRVAVAGYRLGPLPESDLDRMEHLLDEALSAGATGFSTGLMYAPGSSAPFEELQRLCRVVARRDKVYTSHMRSYTSGLVTAVDEQVELARTTGCKLQISHLQAAGAPNWGLQQPALDRIEAARTQGIDIAFDCYPYVAGSTVLTQLLPDWVMEGGAEGMVTRLLDPAERKRAADDVTSRFEWRWRDIYISAVGSAANQSCVGKNLAQLGEERGKDPVQVMLDLLVEERAAVNMLSFNQSEANLKQTLQHPLSIIISDGFYVRGRAHPRLYGTFPLLLGTMCRSRGWLKLEDAIHKITAKPAERFRMEGRGRLLPGYHADITVFDAETVDSPATYEDPEAPPVGIAAVFRNGRLIQGTMSDGSFVV